MKQIWKKDHSKCSQDRNDSKKKEKEKVHYLPLFPYIICFQSHFIFCPYKVFFIRHCKFMVTRNGKCIIGTILDADTAEEANGIVEIKYFCGFLVIFLNNADTVVGASHGANHARYALFFIRCGVHD